MRALPRPSPLRPLAALVVGLFVWAAAPAAAFESESRAAILVEGRTGDVLYAKNPDLLLPPASMSKLMTVYMLFDALRAGRVSLDDTFPVSEKAWRKGGSKMFVEVNTEVKVEDLIQGIIVQSGNDACIVVAEALAGTEEEFAKQMTERAREIGLTKSVFKNASGWPHPEHLVTVRDLATLARHLVQEFPEYYEYFSQREFTYNDITQYARNPLLKRNVDGVDGLKTGHTSAAGYGLTASAERDGRRLILVVAGNKTSRQRATEAQRLLEYGYRSFGSYVLFEAGQTVENAEVWLGEQQEVALVPQSDIVVTLPREARRELEARVVFDGPVPAPVEAGMPLGRLLVTAPGIEPMEHALVAADSVPAVNLFGRMSSALNYLLWGPS